MMDENTSEFLYGIAVVDPTTGGNEIAVRHFVAFDKEPTMYDYIMVYRELVTIKDLEFDLKRPWLLVPASTEIIDAINKKMKTERDDITATFYEDYSHVEKFQ